MWITHNIQFTYSLMNWAQIPPSSTLSDTPCPVVSYHVETRCNVSSLFQHGRRSDVYFVLWVYSLGIKKSKTRSIGTRLFDKNSLKHTSTRSTRQDLLCTTNVPRLRCIS